MFFSLCYLKQFNHPSPDIVNLYTKIVINNVNTAETDLIGWVIGMDEDLLEVSLNLENTNAFSVRCFKQE